MSASPTVPKIVEAIEKPIGPLPVWAWAIVGVGGVFVFRYFRNSGASSVLAAAAPATGATSPADSGQVPASTGTPGPPNIIGLSPDQFQQLLGTLPQQEAPTSPSLITAIQSLVGALTSRLPGSTTPGPSNQSPPTVGDTRTITGGQAFPGNGAIDNHAVSTTGDTGGGTLGASGAAAPFLNAAGAYINPATVTPLLNIASLAPSIGGPSRNGVYAGGTPAGPPPGMSLTEWLSGYSGNTYELASQYIYLLRNPSAISQAGSLFQRDAAQGTLATKAALLTGAVIQAGPENAVAYAQSGGVKGPFYAGFSPSDLALVSGQNVSGGGLPPDIFSPFLQTGWNPATLASQAANAVAGAIPNVSNTQMPSASIPAPSTTFGGGGAVSAAPIVPAGGAPIQGGGLPNPFPSLNPTGSPGQNPVTLPTTAPISATRATLPYSPQVLITLQGYITNLLRVQNPTAAQKTELAGYQTRLTTYQAANAAASVPASGAQRPA